MKRKWKFSSARRFELERFASHFPIPTTTTTVWREKNTEIFSPKTVFLFSGPLTLATMCDAAREELARWELSGGDSRTWKWGFDDIQCSLRLIECVKSSKEKIKYRKSVRGNSHFAVGKWCVFADDLWDLFMPIKRWVHSWQLINLI